MSPRVLTSAAISPRSYLQTVARLLWMASASCCSVQRAALRQRRICCPTRMLISSIFCFHSLSIFPENPGPPSTSAEKSPEVNRQAKLSCKKVSPTSISAVFQIAPFSGTMPFGLENRAGKEAGYEKEQQLQLLSRLRAGGGRQRRGRRQYLALPLSLRQGWRRPLPPCLPGAGADLRLRPPDHGRGHRPQDPAERPPGLRHPE